MNTVIKEKTEAIKEIVKLCGSSDTYEENTRNAVTYFINNKEDLKYLLSAYKISNRSEVALDHFRREFGHHNKDEIRRLLNREKVWSSGPINFLTYIVPLIVVISIVTVIILYFNTSLAYWMTPVSALIIYCIIVSNLEDRNTTRALTYKLSPAHRSLKKPNRLLGE